MGKTQNSNLTKINHLKDDKTQKLKCDKIKPKKIEM